MKKKEETTMGTLIKEACLKKKITIDELYEKLIDIQNKRKPKKNIRNNNHTEEKIKLAKTVCLW